MADNKRYPVPRGFRTLLECLAREVLRSQPTDIYKFSALFFQKLLHIRDEVGINPIDNSDIYDQFKLLLSEEASKLNLIGPESTVAKIMSQQPSDPPPADTATAKHAGEQSTDLYNTNAIEPDGLMNKAATKIQSQFRGFKTREKIYDEHPELVEHLKHDQHEGDVTRDYL